MVTLGAFQLFWGTFGSEIWMDGMDGWMEWMDGWMECMDGMDGQR